MDITDERPADRGLIEPIIARAFGPGRLAKAAERLREGSAPVLSLIAWKAQTAIGGVRLWPISIGETPALLLGPIAVEKAHRNAGVGAALVARACEAATAAGHDLVLLVGDEAYFGRLGFSAAPAKRVAMPGPVDQRRVLVRALAPGAAEALAGPVMSAAAPAERVSPSLKVA
jgi:predicted N-acetyltransferase YhbS